VRNLRSAVVPLTTLERVNLAFAMTWAAGFVDLVGFVALYGLYTSHMTGNTVGMAREISLLDWPGVVRHGWPIAMFIFGLMAGSFIYEAEKRRSIAVPFPPAIALEAVLLGIFIAAATGSNFKAEIPPQPAAKFFLMVALLAVPMGIQNVVIRKVGGINVYTTFVTGSLVKFAESLSEYLFWVRDRTRGRFRSRIGKVIRVTPRLATAQQAALTLGLWMLYLTGGVCGGFALQEFRLLAMLAPFTLLASIALYGAFRPLLPIATKDW
jgi:uncharacterized membrane protein YoaK (UPF0700 family)